MKHPDNSQWLDYLYGEASPAEQFTLKVHLDQCAECAQRVRKWETTRGSLDAWTLPATAASPAAIMARRNAVLPEANVKHSGTFDNAAARGARPTDAAKLIPLPRSRWLPWAAAAAVVLGAFAFGRLSAPPAPDAATLRAEIQTLVAARLDELSRRQSTHSVSQEQFVQLVEALRSARVEDRETLLTRLQQIEQQRAAEYATLRQDLETVAWQAENRLKNTQAQLGELARFSPTQP